MSTLRNELRKKLITLDSDFYKSITTDSDFGFDSDVSYSTNVSTRKLPRAFKKYKITIDDDTQQQQTNNKPAAGGDATQNNSTTTTNNTSTNNGDNNKKSVGDKAKGFWKKFVQWFKNFWKTIWQNIQNTWNTLTANYKHLEQEANNLPNDFAAVVREQIDQSNAAQTKEIQGDINLSKQSIQKDIKDASDEMNNIIKPIGQKINSIDGRLGTMDGKMDKLSQEGQKGVITITKAVGGEGSKILGTLNNNYKSFSEEMKVCLEQAKQNNVQKCPTKSSTKFPEVLNSYKVINGAWLKLLTDIDSTLGGINNDSDVTKLVQCIVNYNNTLNTEVKKPKMQEALKNRGVDIDNIIETTQNSKPANTGEVLEFVPFYVLEMTFKNGLTIEPKGGVLRCVKNAQNQELYQNVEMVPFANNNQQQGGGNTAQTNPTQPAQTGSKQPAQTGNAPAANGQTNPPAKGKAPAASAQPAQTGNTQTGNTGN